MLVQQHRRRDIFVVVQPKPVLAPSGAASSGIYRPGGAGDFNAAGSTNIPILRSFMAAVSRCLVTPKLERPSPRRATKTPTAQAKVCAVLLLSQGGMVTQRGGAAYPQIRPQLQPETGVEPGELREIDGGSGLKARRQRRPSKKAVNGRSEERRVGKE